MENQVKSVVIVGGGTAGWMVAASLAHTYKKSLRFTLVESANIGTVGVGEATIPTIRRFYRALGFTDTEVIQKTKATCKLGIEFHDWHKLGERFFHPFGLFGQDVNGIKFHHYWLKLKQLGEEGELADYSLPIQMAKQNKFELPSEQPRSMLSIYDWALHFDAGLFAQMLQEFAIAKGIRHVQGEINDVLIGPDDGFIQGVKLHSGQVVEGDLFIDCSGFKGLLIDKALQSEYLDWSEWLVCDRAVAMQSEISGAPSPYTIAKAHEAGWQWQIPLQHRQGNGMVYCSQHCGDEQALDLLKSNVSGRQTSEARMFKFTPGVRKQAWKKNCIAVGLAAGFIEPLESTSIALIETAIEKIKLLFPVGGMSDACIEEFNEMTLLEYERVRDFIILHYSESQRQDSPMWRYCTQMQLPDSLQRKIDLYRERGHLVKYRWEIFQPASWTALYSGFGITPKVYDPAVDAMDIEYLRRSAREMRKSLRDSVSQLMTHQEFLAQRCGVEVGVL